MYQMSVFCLYSTYVCMLLERKLLRLFQPNLQHKFPLGQYRCTRGAVEKNQHPFYIYNRVQIAVFNRITYLESFFSLSRDIHRCPLKLLGDTPVRCVSKHLNKEGY